MIARAYYDPLNREYRIIINGQLSFQTNVRREWLAMIHHLRREYKVVVNDNDDPEGIRIPRGPTFPKRA